MSVMPLTIDLGLLALATSETIPVPSSRPTTSKFSTKPSHCDNREITYPPPIPLPDTASTPAIRTRAAIRREGQPALMRTHDHNQEGGRNISLRASFLRSTLFCAPFRCGFNPVRLPMKLCRTRTPRATFTRTAFVSLRPYDPDLQPTLVFPPASSYDVVETGVINTPAGVVELLKPAHTITRIGCAGMLALLSTLGRHEMA